jgi:hypothetical protein
MIFRCGKVCIEIRDVERKFARGVELNFVAGDEEIRRTRGRIFNRLAQTENDLAQIVARGSFGFIGPKEPDERVAAVRAPRKNLGVLCENKDRRKK